MLKPCRRYARIRRGRWSSRTYGTEFPAGAEAGRGLTMSKPMTGDGKKLLGPTQS